MAEDNKIIPFSAIHKNKKSKENKIISYSKYPKERRKAQYYLKTQLSIYLCRKNGVYTAQWFSQADEKISDYEIYIILKSIFSKIENKLPSTMSKRKENYEITFSLLYYENEKDENDFRYICTTPNVTTKQLAEYLLLILTMYEMKNPVS